MELPSTDITRHRGAPKSNEIVAIPALLDMMAIEGDIVTIVLRLRSG